MAFVLLTDVVSFSFIFGRKKCFFHVHSHSSFHYYNFLPFIFSFCFRVNSCIFLIQLFKLKICKILQLLWYHVMILLGQPHSIITLSYNMFFTFVPIYTSILGFQSINKCFYPARCTRIFTYLAHFLHQNLTSHMCCWGETGDVHDKFPGSIHGRKPTSFLFKSAKPFISSIVFF